MAQPPLLHSMHRKQNPVHPHEIPALPLIVNKSIHSQEWTVWIIFISTDSWDSRTNSTSKPRLTCKQQHAVAFTTCFGHSKFSQIVCVRFIFLVSVANANLFLFASVMYTMQSTFRTNCRTYWYIMPSVQSDLILSSHRILSLLLVQ